MPHVRRLWQDHQRRRLVEPFCGGLAMSLGLRPRRALLNDVNPHLVSFYRQLARGLTISLPMENASEAYYANRRSFNALLAAGHGHTAEAASLFYYLNRTGFNGLCRFNSRGEFNVPFGRYARIAYVRDFSAYRPAFARWVFSSVDFEALPLKRGDFVYADPPYDVPFTQYAQDAVPVGRPGAHSRVAGPAQGAGGAVEPGHAARRGALPEAGLRPALPPRAAAHQLHRRSHAGPRGARDAEPVTEAETRLRAQKRQKRGT